VIIHLTAKAARSRFAPRRPRRPPYQPEDVNLTALLAAHGEGQPVLMHGDHGTAFLTDGAPPVTSLVSVPSASSSVIARRRHRPSPSPPGNRSPKASATPLRPRRRAAASIDNIRLFENLQATFRETIQGFARALEAMDRYTAGHSDRVTRLSRMIALELDLPLDEVETITRPP